MSPDLDSAHRDRQHAGQIRMAELLADVDALLAYLGQSNDTRLQSHFADVEPVVNQTMPNARPPAPAGAAAGPLIRAVPTPVYAAFLRRIEQIHAAGFPVAPGEGPPPAAPDPARPDGAGAPVQPAPPGAEAAPPVVDARPAPQAAAAARENLHGGTPGAAAGDATAPTNRNAAITAHGSSTADPFQELGDYAFLLWARDALASIAAPATPETIRLTLAIHRARSRSWAAFFSCRPSPASRDRFERAGLQFSARIFQLNLSAVVTLLAVVLISAFCLSGQAIVSGRERALHHLAEINKKIFDLETNATPRTAPPSAAAPPAAAAPSPGLQLAGQIGAPGEGTQRAAGSGDGADATSARLKLLCDTIGISDERKSHGQDHGQSAPSFGPVSNQVYFVYRAYTDAEVCREKRRTQAELFALSQQVIAWQRWVPDMLLPIFGSSREVFDEFGSNKFTCESFTAVRLSDTIKSCGDRIREITEYYGRVPEAILTCLSNYILPCLYGLLGGIVATMREYRLRLAAFSLRYSDRARTFQNLALGAASGAIIGLFASNVGKDSQYASIGLSGMAFLAGYNVRGLYRLLDDISARLFRTDTPGKASSTN